MLRGDNTTVKKVMAEYAERHRPVLVPKKKGDDDKTSQAARGYQNQHARSRVLKLPPS